MRLNNTIRENILRKAMKDMPETDYQSQLGSIIQEVLYKHMPENVKKVYLDPNTRGYLQSFSAVVHVGNRYNNGLVAKTRLSSEEYSQHFYGPLSTSELQINIEERVLAHLKRGTLSYDLAHAVNKSGLYQKHREQSRLRADIQARLKATLEAAPSTQKLREILEPELHYLIPEETDTKANLPAKAAPVVADMRRLGAKLPPDTVTA